MRNSEVHTFATKVSVETVFTANGKPYLRMRIPLAMIVLWPFCDFFFKNLIPTLAKLAFAKKRKV